MLDVPLFFKKRELAISFRRRWKLQIGQIDSLEIFENSSNNFGPCPEVRLKPFYISALPCILHLLSGIVAKKEANPKNLISSVNNSDIIAAATTTTIIAHCPMCPMFSFLWLLTEGERIVSEGERIVPEDERIRAKVRGFALG